jgi:DNA invertase Pin-like site-specific DNA recombinase
LSVENREMPLPFGRQLGYARVQDLPGTSLAPQLHSLSALGVPDELIFVDRKSGNDSDRVGLKALIACARPGDTIVVHNMDQIGRDLDEVSSLLQDLVERGISVRTASQAP